jgi:hypothetical protein
MKIIASIGLFLAIVLCPALGFGQDKEQDSVVVSFGKESKLIFLIKVKEDYEVLGRMNLNKIAQDLTKAMDTTRNVAYVKFGNADKDGTIVVEVKENNRSAYYTRVKVGNWEIISDESKPGNTGTTVIKSEPKKSVIVDREVKTRRTFNIDLGINNYFESGESSTPSSNELYAVKPWGSWAVALGYNHKTRVAGPFVLNYGVNFSWYNFKFDNTATQILKGPDEVLFTNRNDVSGIKSKLTASYVNLQFVPMFDFGFGRKTVISRETGNVTFNRYRKDGFRIGAGMYAGHRLGSHTKARFRTDGTAQRDKERGNYYLEDWRYGVRGQMGWRRLDLFFNYDLNNLFQTNRGPELNAFSFGVVF